MNNKEQSVQNNQEKKPMKRTAIRPEYNQFIQQLRVVIEDKNIKNPVLYIFTLLKKGFKEKAAQEHLDEIAAICFPREDFPLLAIRILINTSSRKPPLLFKLLSPKIREEMARQTAFPFHETPLFANVADSERKEILKQWVTAHKKEGSIEYSWAQKAIACMLEFSKYEMHHADLEIIEYIMENCFLLKKKNDKKDENERESYRNYIRELVKPFLSKNISKSKVISIKTFIRYKTNSLMQAKEEIINLSEQLELEQRKSHDFLSQLTETKEELDKTIVERDNFRNLLREKEEIIDKEQEKYQALENYWQKESRTTLSKAVMSIKKELSHEIQELKLSLDRENPNTRMALSRVKNMEDYMAKIGESE